MGHGELGGRDGGFTDIGTAMGTGTGGAVGRAVTAHLRHLGGGARLC
jgi:hypothetical protein